MRKIISLTFDYELFLKRSGTLENCIIKPVDRLIRIFEKTGIKATFFIDSLYYKRLIEKNTDQAKLVEEQLKKLISRGQRIELHLHPIWLDAFYKENQWYFPDYRYYRLDGMEINQVNELFTSQTNLLNDIARQVDKNYSVMAYRSGGLCIEPFNMIKAGFLKAGILVDSSVAFNTSHYDGIHNYDFRNFPNIEFYKFSTNTGEVEKNGLFTEIPITTYKINIFDKIMKKIHFRSYKDKFRIYGDGEGISLPVKRTFIEKVTDTFSMFSLEGINPDFLIKKIDNSEKKVINFISHPKLLSESSFECIEKMHSKGYKFKNLKEIYEMQLNEGTEV